MPKPAHYFIISLIINKIIDSKKHRLDLTCTICIQSEFQIRNFSGLEGMRQQLFRFFKN